MRDDVRFVPPGILPKGKTALRELIELADEAGHLAPRHVSGGNAKDMADWLNELRRELVDLSRESRIIEPREPAGATAADCNDWLASLPTVPLYGDTP